MTSEISNPVMTNRRPIAWNQVEIGHKHHKQRIENGIYAL